MSSCHCYLLIFSPGPSDLAIADYLKFVSEFIAISLRCQALLEAALRWIAKGFELVSSQDYNVVYSCLLLKIIKIIKFGPEIESDDLMFYDRKV